MWLNDAFVTIVFVSDFNNVKSVFVVCINNDSETTGNVLCSDFYSLPNLEHGSFSFILYFISRLPLSARRFSAVAVR
jgi:hypothetical protein